MVRIGQNMANWLKLLEMVKVGLNWSIWVKFCLLWRIMVKFVPNGSKWVNMSQNEFKQKIYICDKSI